MAKTKSTTEKSPPTTLQSVQRSEWIVGLNSDTKPVLSVVMPTMNEEEGIKECIERVEKAAAELKIPTEIVVSDSSSDRTPEIARDLGAIVVEPDEIGYGYAYRFGFEHARGKYIAMGDADTTYDFEQIPELLRHLEDTGADMVLGSRLEGEIKPGAMPPLHQYVGNPLLTKFLNVFYDVGVSDAHSGFRVFRRSVIENLDLECDGMEFASEMIMKAEANDVEISEIPITYYPREGEATLDSFRDGWRHVRFMLQNAPGYLFTVPGFAFVLVGVSMLILSLLGEQISGIFFGIHTAIIGSLFTLVGFQVASLAVFSTVTADPIRAAEDSITQHIRANVRLEHGAKVGLSLFIVGSVYLSVVTFQLLTADITASLLIVPNILAFTAIVIGIQTIFSSFFLSMIATESDR